MLYYLRHGQCIANAAHVFAGQEDNSDLTPLGKQQPLDAAKDAQDRGLKVTRIICSPLIRTRRTAEIFAEAIGFDVSKIENDPRLMERKMGVVSGLKYEDAPEGDWSILPGVEPPQEVLARVLSFWREHKDTAGLLVVGHDGAQKFFEAARQNVPFADLPTLPSFPQDRLIEIDVSWLSK